MIVEASDGLLQYMCRVLSVSQSQSECGCIYCAVTGSCNTVPVHSVTLVQVTGPPGEGDLAPLRSESTVSITPPDIVTAPEFEVNEV